MKVGIDTFSIRELKLDPFGQLDWIKAHGFAGAQFGSLGTDVKKLQEIKSHADSQGLYSYTSVSSPNPHLGNQSFKGIRKTIAEQIEAAAEVGWHELHSSLGSDTNRYRHPSVSWQKQLADSVHVLQQLAPELRASNSRINLEPHFDTTSFELVMIAETVGPDICGVCLDTANVILFGEHPVEAAKRVAPYTHQTHLKDAFPYFGDKGLMRQTCEPGKGAIDWEQVLSILGEYSPDLPLSIEDHKWLFGAEIFESWWHGEQPDLTRKELSMTMQLAWQEQQKITSGERMDPDEYEEIPYLEELETRLHNGRDYLNLTLEKLGLSG
jgi:sugar phosphate isomerase/epimerase